MQLALILALNLGRREADLIRLRWDTFKGDYILVTNRKSGRENKFPARTTPALRETLESYRRSLTRLPRHDETILTTTLGKPWKDSHFSTKFSAAKNRAGLTDLHFHDLRGTAVTVLSEVGCTPQEIASITGHSLKYVHAILEKYMATTRALN
jgi:integrase